jgi:hypothetical protein
VELAGATAFKLEIANDALFEATQESTQDCKPSIVKLRQAALA